MPFGRVSLGNEARSYPKKGWYLAEGRKHEFVTIQEAECHDCRVPGQPSISHPAPDRPCDEVEVRCCLQSRSSNMLKVQ